MCQQKFVRLNIQQDGYILIIVLSVLVLISLMITATYISTDVSIKTSSYDADRKYALSLAEQASKIASEDVAKKFTDLQNDIIPPVTNYDQYKYPTVFTELLENGPRLITVDGKNWPQYFSDDCSGAGKYPGFCSPPITIKDDQGQQQNYGNGLPVSSRPKVFNQFTGSQCNNSNAVTIDKNRLPNISARNPCYVVEFLGINPNRVLRYRITVIAWGQNAKTTVILESVYEANYD